LCFRAKRWRGTTKKFFLALCAGSVPPTFAPDRCPPLSNSFRRHWWATMLFVKIIETSIAPVISDSSDCLPVKHPVQSWCCRLSPSTRFLAEYCKRRQIEDRFHHLGLYCAVQNVYMYVFLWFLSSASSRIPRISRIIIFAQSGMRIFLPFYQSPPSPAAKKNNRRSLSVVKCKLFRRLLVGRCWRTLYCLKSSPTANPAQQSKSCGLKTGSVHHPA